MRAVADTNVYISALNFGGTAEEILALGRAQAIELCISPSILKEIEGVFTELVHPKETIRVITADEPGNRILECAMEAKAEVVLTGDAHLQQLKTFRGISILSPRAFLETPRR